MFNGLDIRHVAQFEKWQVTATVAALGSFAMTYLVRHQYADVVGPLLFSWFWAFRNDSTCAKNMKQISTYTNIHKHTHHTCLRTHNVQFPLSSNANRIVTPLFISINLNVCMIECCLCVPIIFIRFQSFFLYFVPYATNAVKISQLWKEIYEKKLWKESVFRGLFM